MAMPAPAPAATEATAISTARRVCEAACTPAALAPNPAILVADEPTGKLDEATGRQVMDLMFAGQRERGTTLVLVTHDAALAQRCGRVVRLRTGRIEEPARTRISA